MSDRVSFVILAYNQQDLVQEAIQAAFAQTYDNLEIILSDDCSTDATFAIMEIAAATYRGPHTVRLNRNSENLGVIAHVNKVFELSEGVLIVPSAGDDISRPERCQVLYDAFKDTRPLLLHSDVTRMSAEGDLQDVWSVGARMARMGPRKAAGASSLCIGASCAWNAEMYTLFGPITQYEAYEDLVLSFRAVLANRIVHVPHALVDYRLGGISTGGSSDRAVRQHKRRITQLAVYRQRLEDCRHFAPNRPKVIHLLEFSIEQTELTIAAQDPT